MEKKMKKNYSKPLYYCLLVSLLLFSAAINEAWSQQSADIQIDTSSDNKGQISIVLSVKNAPNKVRSLGFDIIYDPALLTYSDYKKGELTEKFTMFEASRIKKGHIRAGGFMAGQEFIKKGGSGKLITLHFKTLKKAGFKIELKNLMDDIASWKAGNQ